MTAQIFDHTACELGEGPLWHPLHNELFWFDILGKTLHCRGGQTTKSWRFPEHVSAAGWVDENTLLVASETALLRFEMDTGNSEIVHSLEADNPITRSNDGRADPWGGFWIGTMGKNAEKDAGAIHRYFQGELRVLYPRITISNAICFSPERRYAYFADTAQSKIWRQTLGEKDGWPLGDAEVFLDFTNTDINPDGAVCDSEGYLWNAQWGSARLARCSPDGVFVGEVRLPTDNITCPSFGGPKLKTLFATSALQGLSNYHQRSQTDAGKTFVSNVDVSGQQEHQVLIV
ncbi:MAG: SMP-30/gluconolactonase/LRE family protein [Rhodobacteraceae bacterium]|nr:SMP-30/gluconolactonase/LRE family protein [Paracoccaceae bacterium]